MRSLPDFDRVDQHSRKPDTAVEAVDSRLNGLFHGAPTSDNSNDGKMIRHRCVGPGRSGRGSPVSEKVWIVTRHGGLRSTWRYAGWITATTVVVALPAVLAAHARIAPVIVADNATVFLAADRLYEGAGLTAPPPRVPTQSWDWRCDWTGLTQWPMG